MAQAYGDDGFKVNAAGRADPLEEKSSRGLTEQHEELMKKLNKNKRKYKQYKEEYKRFKDPSDEYTSGKKDIDTAFIPDSQKVNARDTIGSATTFSTSALAKEDRKRIEFLIPARNVISTKWTTYEATDIVVVDITKAGQFHQDVVVGGFHFAFLKGVSTFLPLIPPPDDKRWDDYLDDMRHFGFGTEESRLKLCLGQATCKAWFNLKQLSLNQTFYVTQSKFFPLNPSTGEPRATDTVPRIVSFNKKFLDCDPAWESTVPGGRAVYDGMLPSKELCEEFMKKYLAGPFVADRIKRSHMGNDIADITSPADPTPNGPADNGVVFLTNPKLQRSFQNLCLHEDSYEMIKHAMASAYLSLLSCIAETYVAARGHERSNVGDGAGPSASYPPGLIMPQHIDRVYSDTIGNQDAAATLAMDIGLAKVNHPIHIARALLRKAFKAPQTVNTMVSRLYFDGTEWINASTLNYGNGFMKFQKRADNAVPPNATPVGWVANDVNNDAAGPNVRAAYVERLTERWHLYLSNGILNINGMTAPAIGQIGTVVPLDSSAVVAGINQQIYVEFNKFIQPTLDPSGEEIFQRWGINQDNVFKSRQNPQTVKITDRSDNVRSKRSEANSRLRYSTISRTVIP